MIKPNLLVADIAVSSFCLLKDKQLSNVMPRSFIESSLLNTCFLILMSYTNELFLREELYMNRYLEEDYLKSILFNSFCKWTQCIHVETRENILNRQVHEVLAVITDTTDIVNKIKNRSGPRFEPWGTPDDL